MSNYKGNIKARIEYYRKQDEKQEAFLRWFRPQFESLENDICMALELDLDVFKSPRKIRKYADARAILFSITRPITKKHIGLKTLGGLHRKGYDHSSLKKALKKHEDLYGSDDMYTQMFNLLK